jgi:threonyl-tRNA synthetase
MNNDALKTLRHSAAHLLAHAVIELYPDTILTIGPATEEGFFYDMLPATNFKESDLEPIAQRMQEIVARNLPLEHREVPKAQAREFFKNNPFKLELIDQIPGDTVGIATQGNFVDLCRGGHVASTGMLKNFKLLHISGSYWRADRSNQALQRISGTAFVTQEELQAYEKRQEELTQFDHRHIGKQMDLFSFHEEGVGFPFFHPKGQTILNVMKNYMRDLQTAHNYQEISTPTMLSEELWKRSGHYAHYRDKMYFSQVDEQRYAIKPMNCPGAILTYKTRPRSYRELPLKLAEYGHVHRHELSGVLHGLMRVRAFTQDDAHIFCTLDQVEQEISTIVKLIYTMLTHFGFSKINMAIATRPENSIGSSGNTSGSDEFWTKALTALKNALNASGHTYSIKEGEGAFYGPKIDIDIEDSMGRHWQCGTVQVDPFQPENFDISYVASSGKKERPVIIHQAIYGSLERFFAIVLEHTKGNLPFWLAPVQTRILTITDEQKPYAHNVYNLLKSAGIRVEIDPSSDPLSGQIKNAQLEKIPLMLVIGKKEVAQEQVTLRHRDGKQEMNVPLAAIVEKITALNKT